MPERSGQPGIEIVERARAQGALLGRAALFAFGARWAALGTGRGKRRKQAKIDVHGLKGARSIGFRAQMPAGNVPDERAERRGGRRCPPGEAATFGRRGLSGEQADGGALHVTLAARDLAREPEARGDAQAQGAVEELG